MDLSPRPVDVQALMREIRGRVRGEGKEQQFAREARKMVPSHLTSAVARLSAGTASLRSAVAAIGEAPPCPPTLRGRVGLLLVRLSQRSVFWLLPSLRSSLNQIVDALEKHLQATEEILEALRQTNIELARLRSLVRGEGTAPPSQAGGRR